MVVGELMDSVDEDLKSLVTFLDCSRRQVFDRDDLRNLLLCGDSLVVPLFTGVGQGRLTLAVDKQTPVHLLDCTRDGTLSRVWAQLDG